jgi:hypothetical protein
MDTHLSSLLISTVEVRKRVFLGKKNSCHHLGPYNIWFSIRKKFGVTLNHFREKKLTCSKKMTKSPGTH